jgi:signal transduction histidine kinase
MVFTAVEQRRVQFSVLTELDTVVAVKHDLPAVIENILRVLPGTKNVTVINGTSPLERFWLEEMKREFRPFEGRVEFTWTNTLSFDDIMKRAAALPPHSAIFWELMIVDAAGVVYQGDEALQKLHAVANAPIFSFDDSFFGGELAGGPMHSVLEVSQRTAEAAIRILGGAKPSEVKTPLIGFAAPKYDWREMQRWGISEDRLPPDSTIYFRDLGPWVRYRAQIIAVCLALLLQAALISWLIYEHWRRQVAEGESLRHVNELARLNRFATAGELSASIAHEIRQPLAAIAASGSAGLNWLKQNVPNLDEVRTNLQTVVDASHRADDIIKGVRAMFRNESTVRTEVNINELVQQVIGITKRLTEVKDIMLDVNLADQPPLVTADSTQLQQCILNLVVNAVEAMSIAGHQARTLQLWTQVNPDETVLVRIIDSGPGIDAEMEKNMFRPFFTTKSGGMGMGLTICKTIVEAHGGKVTARRNQPSGMEFQIDLPQAPERRAPTQGGL